MPWPLAHAEAVKSDHCRVPECPECVFRHVAGRIFVARSSRALVGYGLFSEEKARVETAERGYHGACDGIPTLDESS